jgi:diguanylate cyclase (GGDEF)-like protein
MPSPLTPSDLPLWDSATRAELEPVTANLGDPEAGDREWALIRYVGHPLGEIIPLPAGGLSIGRAQENLLCLDEPEISRKHAQLDISKDNKGAWLRDMGSTNGLFVNGRKVDAMRAPCLLHPGDVLRVGNHAFKLKFLDAMDQQYHRGVVAQTTIDSLTGVNTRATLLHQLEKHYDLARRHRRPLSLILADLDHFKQINDTFGHAAGDQVLRRFGGLLIGRLRGSDHVGRIGGEEFLLVLPETTAALALSVAEELRKTLERERIEVQGRIIQATCSLGVAELDPSESDSGSLLARADAALYRAKAGGRNRAMPAISA